VGYTPSIIIVTRQTRLEGLRNRWGTLGQAKFRLATSRAIADAASDLESADPKNLTSKTAISRFIGRKKVVKKASLPKTSTQADFDEYINEDSIYKGAVEKLASEFMRLGFPVKTIDRSYVSNYDFGLAGIVVVIGQDGLVANVAKYVGDVPIVAVNPDPQRFDGILLPFRVDQALDAVNETLMGKSKLKQLTLAEAQLNDGQRLLAFNDFFIGAASHVSARYVLSIDNSSESQSSSGVIVSTGAGSTGWISSVFNMTSGVAKFLGGEIHAPAPMPWDLRELQWAVREPFQSRTSQVEMVAGRISDHSVLVIESLMPDQGVIFSDGIEADFLPFASGSVVRILVSKQFATLVIQ